MGAFGGTNMGDALENLEWRQSFIADYEVSNQGHVRLLRNKNNLVKGRLLKGNVSSAGYRRFKIRYNGEVVHTTAHQMVAVAFLGPCPPDKNQVAHWDGNPKNNHVSNLRWATAADNTADKIRHGNHRKGNKKFTDDDIRGIRKMRNDGCRYVDIMDKYRTTKSNISSILSGATWSHVK